MAGIKKARKFHKKMFLQRIKSKEKTEKFNKTKEYLSLKIY